MKAVIFNKRNILLLAGILVAVLICFSTGLFGMNLIGGFLQNLTLISSL